MLPYRDLNRLGFPGPATFDQGIQPFNGPMMHGQNQVFESGRFNGVFDTFTPFQPDPPSVIDQRWPAPHEQFQNQPAPPATFNQRWPGLHEQMPNIDFPLFEGPGETDQDFFRQDVASLSPFTPRGGVIDLGIDPLTSPFAPGVQDLNRPFDRLPGMTGPVGGTDPRFFGGGINMPDWNPPDLGLTPQQNVDHRFPTPWEINTFMSGNDPGRFDHAFNQFPSAGGPSFNDWTRMAGGDFPDAGSQTAMASVPFDDPRGDFIGGGEGGPRSSGPQIALMAPFPSVFDPRSHIQSPPSFGGGMGPGGIPFAQGGSTPLGFTPPLPNFSPPGPGGFIPGQGVPMLNNPSWTSFGSPSFF